MTRHRLAVLTTASLFALSLGVGAALAAGEPDPPGSRNPGPSSHRNRPQVRKETTERRRRKIRNPSRNSATDIARPTRWCRPAITQAAFAAFKSLDADDTRTSRTTRLHRAQARRLRALQVLVRARARVRPEARAHLAVLRHVAGRAGQHAQGRRLPARRSRRSAATRPARNIRTSRAAWKAP